MLPKPPAFLAAPLASPAAVLGDAVSGRAAQTLLAALGAAAVLYDAKARPFDAEAAGRHRLVVYSPGFAAGHPWLELARAAGGVCLGEIDFASLFWRGRIVAVTGTNGKTTTTEFLAHALEEARRPAQTAGNIGLALSEVAAQTAGGAAEMTAVCEVSSFQAETLEHFRAEATIWTNFAEDHLERHGTMERYFAAKANLASRSKRVFAGSSVRAFAPNLSVSWVDTEGQPRDPRLAGTAFAEYPQRENFILAEAWWRAEGLPPEALLRAARGFQLGRHRLSRVAEIDGVAYWNDSKATNFHAVEAALRGFSAPVLLIAGGRGKGGDVAGFIGRAAPSVRQFFLLGETAAELGRACAAAGKPHRRCASLAEAVAAAAEAAAPGEHVLLSPAFASFDMFRNYQDRGDQFEKLVAERRLARTPA